VLPSITPLNTCCKKRSIDFLFPGAWEINFPASS
jgi:hypothetical protein